MFWCMLLICIGVFYTKLFLWCMPVYWHTFDRLLFCDRVNLEDQYLRASESPEGSILHPWQWSTRVWLVTSWAVWKCQKKNAVLVTFNPALILIPSWQIIILPWIWPQHFTRTQKYHSIKFKVHKNSNFATLNIIQILFPENIYQCLPVSNDALCKNDFTDTSMYIRIKGLPSE